MFFMGGLGEDWKVGLEVTEAIGRGIVRLRFLWVLATKVYIYIYTSQIDPVLV